MKFLILTIGFVLCHLIYQFYNMYIGKYAGTLTLYNYRFSTYWTFTFAAVLIATPLLTIANYGFGVGFHIGYKLFDRIWIVLILFTTAQLISAITASYLIFQELPRNGTLLGLFLALSGVLVSILWK